MRGICVCMCGICVCMRGICVRLWGGGGEGGGGRERGVYICVTSLSFAFTISGAP